MSKKDKKNKDDSNQLNTRIVGIKIFRPISDDLVALASEFTAIEEPDQYRNLHAINEEKNYKESHDFTKDNIYTVLSYTLNLEKGNKNKKQKLDIINKAITEQENLLKKIESNNDENFNYNFEDENLKLKQLRVLADSLHRESKGNYIRLGKNGRREYEFISLDGVLYPYFFGSRIYRVHADLTIKKKMFSQENTIFNNELNRNRENRIFTVGMIILLISVAFVFLNIFVGYNLYLKGAEMEETANAGALTCAYTMAQLQSQYGITIDEYLKTKQADLQTLKKNQNNININTNPINIDPTNIINK